MADVLAKKSKKKGVKTRAGAKPKVKTVSHDSKTINMNEMTGRDAEMKKMHNEMMKGMRGKKMK